MDKKIQGRTKIQCPIKQLKSALWQGIAALQLYWGKIVKIQFNKVVL
jgi:hypothetical protein